MEKRGDAACLSKPVKFYVIVCLVLAAAAVYELALMVPRVNPLAGVAIPALPTLPADTNSAPPVVKPGTNAQTAAMKGTNKPAESTGTNSLASKSTNGTGSIEVTSVQLAAANTNAEPGESNATTITDTTNMSLATQGANGTNAASPGRRRTAGNKRRNEFGSRNQPGLHQ